MSERPIKHGTVNGYTRRKCRCEACVDAWRISQREGMQRFREHMRETERYREMAHGLTYTYNVGCRCDACRAANAEYTRARRRRIREAEGGDRCPSMSTS